MELLEEWLKAESTIHNDAFIHREPKEEMRFYVAIAFGNVDYVRKNCDEQRFMDSKGVGILSKDYLQNLKYHFVICTAMITRICYENGMEFEKAFRLSDFYIQKLDNIYTINDVRILHDKMCMDYVLQMKKLRNRPALSRPINDCLNYIYTHIQERITIEDLAEYTNNSTSYISRLFKDELGISTSDYIRNKKLIPPKTCCVLVIIP